MRSHRGLVLGLLALGTVIAELRGPKTANAPYPTMKMTGSPIFEVTKANAPYPTMKMTGSPIFEVTKERQWRANKERRERERQWRAKRRHKNREYQLNYYYKNRERLAMERRAAWVKYYEKHKDKIKEKQREYMKKKREYKRREYERNEEQREKYKEEMKDDDHEGSDEFMADEKNDKQKEYGNSDASSYSFISDQFDYQSDKTIEQPEQQQEQLGSSSAFDMRQFLQTRSQNARFAEESDNKDQQHEQLGSSLAPQQHEQLGSSLAPDALEDQVGQIDSRSRPNNRRREPTE